MTTTTTTTSISNAIGTAPEGLTRRPRRFVRLLAALTATAALVLGLGATAASAGTVDGWIGQPGQVVYYKANAQIVYKQNMGNLSGLKVPGPWVSRSPAASGLQYVSVALSVERHNGVSWIAERTFSYMSSINAWSSGVRLPDEYVQTAGGKFRVLQLSVVWLDGGGRTLGGLSLRYNTASDYSCHISCWVGPGWVAY